MNSWEDIICTWKWLVLIPAIAFIALGVIAGRTGDDA